ncbi:MAG: ribonuclease Z [Bacteroidia bacterium]|nr:ribonuclease Z [Bacteroidia bacterium]
MFQVQILGTSSAIPTNSRLPSAQVVTINDRHHLVDCGEGAQMQMLRYRIRYARLDAIFISHLHGDHILGLPGLLTTLSLYERNYPLRLYAPSGIREILDVVFRHSQSYLNYELEFYPMEDFKPGDIIYQTDRFKVEALPLEHRIFCRGFKFIEINKKPRFNFFRAKELEVPNAYFPLLKQGNTITLEDGRTIYPEDVLQPPEEVLSYAYCSDTRYTEALIDYIRDTKLLYHESTFLNNLRARADETWHSTAYDAARIACQAQVRQLILGHFSARYEDLGAFLDEARSIFPHTLLGREGHVYQVKDFI